MTLSATISQKANIAGQKSGRSLTADEVRERARQACEDVGGQLAWAERHGMSASYLCTVLMGKKPPGPKVLRALGLRRCPGYEDDPRRAGRAPQPHDPTSEANPAAGGHGGAAG